MNNKMQMRLSGCLAVAALLWNYWFLGLSSGLIFILVTLIHVASIVRHFWTARGLRVDAISVVIWALFGLIFCNFDTAQKMAFGFRRDVLKTILAEKIRDADETSGSRGVVTVLGRKCDVVPWSRQKRHLEVLFRSGLATRHRGYLRLEPGEAVEDPVQKRWKKILPLEADWYFVAD